MKRNYMTPTVERIAFDYKAQIVTGSPVSNCFESVMNERPANDPNNTSCVGGTPVSFGWNDPQTLV